MKRLVKTILKKIFKPFVSRYQLILDKLDKISNQLANLSAQPTQLQLAAQPKNTRGEPYKKQFRQIERNFIEIDNNKKEELYNCLSEFFFASFEDGYLNSDSGKRDMENHMINRLLHFRENTMPWLNSLTPLKQSKILEIGCGTGCSTVVLAEQGCKLTSIDINDMHIKVAKKRCELYGLSVNISAMNATEINKIDKKFDLIIFSASLEHMTYEERLISLKLAWDMLENNGFLVVIETPNRLSYFDWHSSMLPFYHWLPDQIAMKYSKFSPRELCAIECGSDELKLIRFGRGVSFHEFEIALKIRCGDLEISSMQSFDSTYISKEERDYNQFIKKLGPQEIPEDFYYHNLELAIKKTYSA